MMNRIERLGFLIAVYIKSLFAHKQLIVCALLSGLCCLAVLLGAATVFSPNDQYRHFTSELYCQWVFDEPVDCALIAEQLARDMDNGQIAEIHAIAKSYSDSVLVYGLSDNVFMTKNDIMYGNPYADPMKLQCYIDKSLIPYEYDVKMDELAVSINGVDFKHVGKSFLLPYNFPPAVISQIGYDKKLSVLCKQNADMRIYGNANINEKSDKRAGTVYVPLTFMAQQHTRIGAIAITMNEPLTESARAAFESKYRTFNFKTFTHPTLSNWSHLTHEMMGQTKKEMWAVEIIMFACMINQLVFWEILMRRLKPVIKRCRMIGGSGMSIKSSLMAFITLVAIMIVIFAAPLYILGMSRGSNQLRLSIQGAVSASVIWVIGLVIYCLLIVRDRMTKGW